MRFQGWVRWQKTIIPFPVLRPLLLGRLDEAVSALRSQEQAPPLRTEISALAIASAAVSKENTSVLEQLERTLENLPSSAPIARALAVVKADRARLSDPVSAAAAEAEALRMIPAGHPRRLSLALFVACAALDQGDGESAVKALRMLHSRDVVYTTSRAVIDWLLMEGAKMAGDESLAGRCHNALRGYQLGKVASMVNTDVLPNGDDPYQRWITRAKEGLQTMTKVNSS